MLFFLKVRSCYVLSSWPLKWIAILDIILLFHINGKNTYNKANGLLFLDVKTDLLGVLVHADNSSSQGDGHKFEPSLGKFSKKNQTNKQRLKMRAQSPLSKISTQIDFKIVKI